MVLMMRQKRSFDKTEEWVWILIQLVVQLSQSISSLDTFRIWNLFVLVKFGNKVNLEIMHMKFFFTPILFLSLTCFTIDTGALQSLAPGALEAVTRERS